jgi:sulfate permease, SulP family
MGRHWLTAWREVLSQRSFLQEVLAGLTVAAVALPLNLALAAASGLPASAGLIAGAIGGMLAGAFGGASLSITGPAAALNVMVFAIAKDFGPGGVAAAALIVGGIQILLAFTLAGKLVKHVPEAVLAGFTTGVGIKLLDNQIPELLGFNYRVYELAQMLHRPEWLREVSWLAMVCGLAVAFVVVTTKQWPRFPAALVGVAAVTALSIYLGWNVERVGEVPSSLPPLSFPSLPDGQWLELMGRALPLGLLAAAESLLCAKAVERMLPDAPPNNPNLELVGQGIANVGVGLLAGMPVSAVFVRTGVNVQSGARTRMSAIIHGAALLLAVLVMSADISQIPLSALSGLLLVIAWRLIEVSTLVHLFKTERAGALAFLASAVGTVSGHLVTGLGLGLGIHFAARWLGRGTREREERERAARKTGVRAVLEREDGAARRPTGWEPLPSAKAWLSHIRDRALVARSAYVHPQSAVIGKVVLGEHVHIAAGSSVRADEGAPFFIGDNSNVQDGVVIHALQEKHVSVAGEQWAVYVGKNVSIAHGAIVHGPCYVGDDTFIGFKAVVHDSVVGSHCFIGIGAIVVGVEIPDQRFVPHGAIVDSADAVAKLAHVSEAHREFNEDVVDVNRGLAAAYLTATREDGVAARRPLGPRVAERDVWDPAFTRVRGVRF